MKIDPPERALPFSRQVVNKAKVSQGSDEFGAVLQDTLEKSSGSKGCTGSSIGRVRGPLATTDLRSGCKISEGKAAQRLLDKLECYQKMLADPAVSLKMIQPAVEQMEKQAADTQVLFANIPDGHPLKAVIQDTIASISQEIKRFNSGYYVDD
jgi:hypothetical protein